MTGSPDFSKVARSYAASRPTYPAELFAWLASIVDRRETAWDTATGNGQAALGLAEHFNRVIATDVSTAQLEHAVPHPHVEYRVASAEESGLAPDSVDLVVAAAALHWFDLPKFDAEVRRVTRKGGAVAAWTYHVAHVEPPFDAVFLPFYRDLIAPYFAAGARLVDDRYEGITLPGTRLDAPRFVTAVRWTEPQVLSFIRTWSGVQSYIEATGEDPVAAVAPQIARVCGTPDSVHEIRWPVYLRAARL